MSAVDGLGTPLSVALTLGRGRLGGIIKDNFDIAGLTTTMGSNAYASDAPAPHHAEVVERLLAAGFRIDGRAKMHELAYGVTGINTWSGTPINPNWPDRIPGGSSSGCAAAVAGNLADFAIGTDTGGSVRLPAACCGVVGFKPSFGRVSRNGVMPRSSSLDCVGSFARDVATVESVMVAIDPNFVVRTPPVNFRIGVVAVQADSDIVDAFVNVVGALGFATVPIALDGLDDAFDAGVTIIGAEMFAEFGNDDDHVANLGADVRTRLLSAKQITPRDVEMAETVRMRFRAEVDAALENVDVLALPTLPIAPPLLRDVGNSAQMLRLTALVRPFNLTGHPAISLPIRTARGLPAGLQLVGRMNADADLCAIARAIENKIAPSAGAY